jgi:hypothetical protein
MSHPISSRPCVAAVVVTYQREKELARLLECLSRSNTPITGGVFVADNAASPATQELCTRSALPVTWLPRDINNGPGPAWNTGIRAALTQPSVTHLLVLDDDVAPPPETLEVLLDALAKTGAAAAAPLLLDENQTLWAFPEPVETPLRQVIRRVSTIEQCRVAFGSEPLQFCWATGACMLYAREALAETGPFREDFWMLGEDLELSMRVAATLGGVFTARTAVPHLPPPPVDPESHVIGHRLKFLALLQNLSYLAFHSPHSGHLRRYLAGNFKRYLRTEGCAPGTLHDGWSAFWLGAICGQPAGTGKSAILRERVRRRLTADLPA